MKAKEDKNLEKFVDKIMKDASLETPSFDFTSKVMSKVFVAQNSETTMYKPLISKLGLTLVLSGIFMFFGYFSFNGNAQSNKLLDSINLDRFYNFRFFHELEFSEITMYAVVLATVMLFIQIPILKNHFEKRFEL